MGRPWMGGVGAALWVYACAWDAPRADAGGGGPGADAAPPAPPIVQLIDSAIPPAVAGEAGWDYHQSVEADLTDDGQPERVVLTARVELVRGRPRWSCWRSFPRG